MEAHAHADPPASAAGLAEAARVRAEVPAIFAVLVVLTVAEVLVSRLHAGRAPVITALVGLAIAKAGLVGLFFMHLRHETRVLRWTVLGPLVAPGLYGLVLAADAAWRMLP